MSTLTVQTPTALPTAAQNGVYAYQLTAKGGAPPYIYWVKTANTGSNTWTVTASGWLYGVPTALSTDTVTVQCVDCENNASAAVTLSITTTAAIQFAGIDRLNNGIKLPNARVGRKYWHQLRPCDGGTGAGQVFSVVSGALPAGISMSAGGLFTGTPTQSGNPSFTLQCVDSGSNTTAVTAALNVGGASTGTRPAANTASGFFVDTTGQFCDPGGFRVGEIFSGLNRDIFNSSGAAAAGVTAGCSVVRYTMYRTDFRGTIPANSSTMTGYSSIAVNDHTNNKQFVIFTMFLVPGTTTFLSGGTTVTDMGTIAAWWCDNVATFNGTALHNRSGINVANEWGPNGASWQSAYQAVNQIPIASVAGTTITLNSNAATHPFANASVIGYVYLGGGNINKAIQISGTGGAQGAWTVTATNVGDVSGYTSAGTLSGGAIGMLRAAGYTEPIFIDAPSFGQDNVTYQSFAVAVGQSDPLQNCVFSYHAYGRTNNYAARISNVSGSTISVFDSATHHPFSPTGIFANVNPVYVSGATGTTTVNGDHATTSNGQAGSSGAWTIPLSSAPTGTYSGGGVAVPSGTAIAHHIDRLVASFQSLTQSGIAFAITEYSAGLGSGPSPTLCSVVDIRGACHAAGMMDVMWAFDDGSSPAFQTLNTGPSWTYTVPTQLTAVGMEVIMNPRFGTHAMCAPAPVFLP